MNVRLKHRISRWQFGLLHRWTSARAASAPLAMHRG
jgi:hypothetical protein